jgi:hypothetical protein
LQRANSSTWVPFGSSNTTASAIAGDIATRFASDPYGLKLRRNLLEIGVRTDLERQLAAARDAPGFQHQHLFAEPRRQDRALLPAVREAKPDDLRVIVDLAREVRRLVGGMAYSLNRNHACFSRCDGFSAAGWRRGLR